MGVVVKLISMLPWFSPCAVCFEERIERCCLELASTLENLNAEVKRKVEGQLQRAAESLAGHVRYHFCDDRGPKWGKVTKEHPLFPRYDTHTYTYILQPVGDLLECQVYLIFMSYVCL